jgi:hypothetical protein
MSIDGAAGRVPTSEEIKAGQKLPKGTTLAGSEHHHGTGGEQADDVRACYCGRSTYGY